MRTIFQIRNADIHFCFQMKSFYLFVVLFSHFGVMQLNASPLLANAAAPAVHKDNWQQRRHTFLSKYSMFGGELKDEVVDQIGANEQGTDIEQW